MLHACYMYVFCNQPPVVPQALISIHEFPLISCLGKLACFGATAEYPAKIVPDRFY